MVKKILVWGTGNVGRPAIRAILSHAELSLHGVIVSGSPTLEVTVHGHDPVEPGLGGGGNASAAAWLVNAIPAVCEAAPGVVTVLDLPRITGAAQLGARRS